MNLEDQLEKFEGKRAFAYQDHMGYWTIGVGILIDRRKGGLYPEEIAFLLGNRIRRIRESLEPVIPWYLELSEPRRAVLEGMAFQMGVNGLLSFKRTLGAVRAERFDEAAEYMGESLWARQTPRRAALLAKQMLWGRWVDPDTGEFVA